MYDYPREKPTFGAIPDLSIVNHRDACMKSSPPEPHPDELSGIFMLPT